MSQSFLQSQIVRALLELDSRGDIVICGSSPEAPAKHIFDAVNELVPNELLTLSELSGLRALVFQAVNDSRFFDWEMSTLTGFDIEKFIKIAEKLPKA